MLIRHENIDLAARLVNENEGITPPPKCFGAKYFPPLETWIYFAKCPKQLEGSNDSRKLHRNNGIPYLPDLSIRSHEIPQRTYLAYSVAMDIGTQNIHSLVKLYKWVLFVSKSKVIQEYLSGGEHWKIILKQFSRYIYRSWGLPHLSDSFHGKRNKFMV